MKNYSFIAALISVFLTSHTIAEQACRGDGKKVQPYCQSKILKFCEQRGGCSKRKYKNKLRLCIGKNDLDGDSIRNNCDFCADGDDRFDANKDNKRDCLFASAGLIIKSEPADEVIHNLTTSSTYDLKDSGGYEWNIQPDGQLAGGGIDLNDDEISDYFGAWITYHRLSINSQTFISQPSASIENSKQLVFGPQLIDGFKVTRKFYAGQGGAYGRWVDIIENTNPTPEPITLGYQGYLIDNGHNASLTLTSDGDTSLSSDSWWYNAPFSNKPAIAGVLFSNPVIIPWNSDSLLEYSSFHGPLEPGQKIGIIHYALMRISGDLLGTTDVQSSAVNFLNDVEKFPLGEDSSIFEEMTAEELVEISGINVKIKVSAGYFTPGIPVSVEIPSTNTTYLTNAAEDGSLLTGIIGTTGNKVKIYSDDGQKATVRIK